MKNYFLSDKHINSDKENIADYAEKRFKAVSLIVFAIILLIVFFSLLFSIGIKLIKR